MTELKSFFNEEIGVLRKSCGFSTLPTKEEWEHNLEAIRQIQFVTQPSEEITASVFP